MSIRPYNLPVFYDIHGFGITIFTGVKKIMFLQSFAGKVFRSESGSILNFERFKKRPVDRLSLAALNVRVHTNSIFDSFINKFDLSVNNDIKTYCYYLFILSKGAQSTRRTTK